jgi:radical SAM protein with 4Fe4S-binding SPASM domain
MTPSGNKFIALTSHCALKHLEEFYLYDIENDELYELGQDAYEFLLRCSRGEKPVIRKQDEEFIQYCLSEHLIAFSETPVRRKIFLHAAPTPSLRYLELMMTDRCNLQCRHCYLGEGQHRDLSFGAIQRIVDEFEEMRGLRLLLSGGEPLLHPHFWKVNDLLRGYEFRSVLLSNGNLITKAVAKKLRVHEVQISLDGMKEGHESIRGRGTFQKALQAIDQLQEAHIQVSVATMIHKKNIEEFDSLASLVESRNIKEWNVDVPCIEGRLKENEGLWVSPLEAGPLLNYGFGGGIHGSKNNATCGAHLCAIFTNGWVAKCGLFSQEAVGSIEEGLRTCWERIPRIPLSDLACDCMEIEACRGGCRYRAKLQGGLFQPDLFQCFARGVLKGGERYDDQESS